MALTVLFKNQNHPIWSQDRGHHSHKYNRAGINYQLGISFAENKRIWMNSLFKAGKNDVSIFTKNGLKNRLLNLKKKAIGDGGYYGHYNCISAPNIHDSKAVWTFKSRAPPLRPTTVLWSGGKSTIILDEIIISDNIVFFTKINIIMHFSGSFVHIFLAVRTNRIQNPRQCKKC